LVWVARTEDIQMPRVKLSKSVIDDLPMPVKEVVYWDVA
jgi:hypothetical protein